MRVLIIRLSSMGDVILTTPVLKKLKEKYEDIEIDFLVMDSFKDAISGSKYVDNLITFDKRKYKGIGGIYKFSKEVLKREYDYIIDLHSKTRSILISHLVKGKVLRYKKRSLLKSLLVKMKLIKYQVDDTIIKNYFGSVSSLGVFYGGEDLDFPFKDSDLESIKEYRNHVVFAPGASKETKKWSVEGFGNLAKLIYEREGKKILLIGGKDDIERSSKINEISGGRCINLAGKLSLKESGALLSISKYLVTNDSGPFHISRGVKTKSYVIFGPTSPGMFSYDSTLEVLIYGDEPCSPCSLHGDKVCPKGHFNCMKNISDKMIFDTIYN